MRFGCIGEHLGHSYSALIHAKFGNDPYTLREVEKDRLGDFFACTELDGFNVTIPYKQAVIPYLAALSPEAEAIGAVNTVIRKDGAFYGYNTDAEGLRALILHAGIPVFRKKVLVLGTGGTAKTARAVFLALGAREVLFVSRTEKDGAISYGDARTSQRDAEILCNATPCGMYPEDENCPLDPADFPRLCGVIDAVYHPLRTELVLRARERGIPAAGGLFMLVSQAAAAARLFTGNAIAESEVSRVYGELLSERQNLVLIGLPGCGKTAVGTHLAQKTERPFYDTDTEFENRYGISPAACIRKEGEAAFRRMEADVVGELAKSDGAVIATGGGTVLRPENVRALKRNGRVFFLDRAPSLLSPSADRPLSDTQKKLYELAEYRRPYYVAAADEIIPANGTVGDAVQDILSRYAGCGV